MRVELGKNYNKYISSFYWEHILKLPVTVQCLIKVLAALTRYREIACLRIFIDSSFCGLKHREIRSDNCKQPLPIDPYFCASV